MSQHRNAALALHGLHPDDQRWVLAKLGTHDRDTLRAYLLELKELGIPAGTDLSDTVAPAPAAAPSLETATAAQVAALLADEPVWLAAHLLALREWSWRSDYLAGLPLARRKMLTHAQQAPLGGRAAQSLRAHFDAKLARVASAPVSRGPTPAPAPKRRTMLLTMRQGVRRWF